MELVSGRYSSLFLLEMKRSLLLLVILIRFKILTAQYKHSSVAGSKSEGTRMHTRSKSHVMLSDARICLVLAKYTHFKRQRSLQIDPICFVMGDERKRSPPWDLGHSTHIYPAPTKS